jgi:hypothetical protein
MLNPYKYYISTVVIFLILFSISPMISKYSGCGGTGSPNMGCAFVTSRKIVFPVYRTIACKAFSQPGCAPDTLLPGWYDQLLNYENLIIVSLLGFVAYKIKLKL